MTPREIFMAKLVRGRAARPAVGSATSVVTADLMDEAGVYFPKAHLDAEAMARLAVASHTVLGFDNVMPLFSVWHESSALGCEVDWGDPLHMPDGGRTPLCPSIDSLPDVPPGFLSHPGCTVPLDALCRLKRELTDEVAIVGKVFGPWTLGYHVYGVQEFLISTVLNPDAVKRAMDRLKQVTIRFAAAQVEAGADAMTLADHCTRDLCSPETYQSFLKDLHAELHERIPCPVILHICGDTSDRIPFIRETGLECFHFDSKVAAATARKLAGTRLSLMGGTSNFDIVRSGTPDGIAADVAEKIASGVDIIGPECAVPLDAPWRNLQLIAAATRG